MARALDVAGLPLVRFANVDQERVAGHFIGCQFIFHHGVTESFVVDQLRDGRMRSAHRAVVIFLQSQLPHRHRQGVEKNDTLAKLQQNLKLKSREKELVQTLAVDTSFIKIELYDNAEIDDDTVSVFLNNTLLLYKKRLSAKPLVLNVTAFPNTEYELMMYAENLGRIPPNTSLMVITAGRKRYQLHLSSSEEKSAVVKFKYDPPTPLRASRQ